MYGTGTYDLSSPIIQVKEKKKEAFILNTCDAWHSWSSMDVIGVYTKQSKAIAAAKRHYSKNNKGKKLDSDEVQGLKTRNQTSGMETNYHINVMDLNVDQF